MDMILLVAILIVVIALFFDFTNGFIDSANQVATIIFSRTLEPAWALFIASGCNFLGAYFLGTAVAQTIGSGIVDPRILGEGPSGVLVVFAALTGAILWNLTAWFLAIPSSSSHSLMGGLIGAFLFGWGINPINWSMVSIIVLVMILSPIIGFFITYIFTQLTLFICRGCTPKVTKVFKKLQIASLITQSLSHGTNDAQKTMGVIVFALIILGLYSPQTTGELIIPHWVVISCALAISLGTIVGGKRIIKKLGSGLYKVRPIHGFTSQVSSTAVIFISSLFGIPVSTSQIISSSVMGAGAAFRSKMVRWKIAQDMALVWLVTIPVSGLVAGITFLILNKIF